MSITFGSLCSGIEAASEAWAPLGWTCAYVAEIEPFPCAYLAERYGAGRPRYMPQPDDADDPKEAARRRTALKTLDRITFGDRLPNFGDVSQIVPDELPEVDLIAAGFPCQDFSIAGLRASTSGKRGALSIIGMRLILEAAKRRRVRAALLEQVPDVLNTPDNAWGNILGALIGADDPLPGLDHGGKWPSAGMVAGPRSRVAWRVLDAQHFRLAQRRERVWAVVDFGDGPDPAAVLFERKGVSGNPPPRRQAGEGTALAVDAGAELGGGGAGRSEDGRPSAQVQVPFGADYGPDIGRPLVAPPAGNRSDIETETAVVQVAGTLDASFARLQGQSGQDANHGHSHLIPVAYSIMPQNSNADYKAREVEVSQPVTSATGVSARGGDVIVQPYTLHGSDGTKSTATETDLHTALRTATPGRIENSSTTAIVQPIAFNARQDPISGPVVWPVDTDPATHAVAFSLRGREGGAVPEVEGEDVIPALRSAEGGSTRPFVAFQGRGSNLDFDQDVAGTIGSNTDRASGGAPMVAFDETQITSKANRSNPKPGDPCHPLSAQGRPPALASDYAVRRITVVEAERLQGFLDNRTLIHWPSANRKGEDLAETIAYLIGHGLSAEDAAAFAQTPDGPRYRALGNSWPVNVARWIGERIQRHMPPEASA